MAKATAPGIGGPPPSVQGLAGSAQYQPFDCQKSQAPQALP